MKFDSYLVYGSVCKRKNPCFYFWDVQDKRARVSAAAVTSCGGLISCHVSAIFLWHDYLSDFAKFDY